MVSATGAATVSRRMKERELREVRDEIGREVRRRPDDDSSPYTRYLDLIHRERNLIDDLGILDVEIAAAHVTGRF